VVPGGLARDPVHPVGKFPPPEGLFLMRVSRDCHPLIVVMEFFLAGTDIDALLKSLVMIVIDEK
jgi:hypothetical protein